MAYRYEKNGEQVDLVIDGFEQGIAPSPYAENLPTAMGNVQHTGIADMRNMNIITVPGEAPVNFSMSAMTTPPTVSAQSFSGASSNSTFTVSSTTGFYVGMAIKFNTLSDATKGVVLNAAYYVTNITATTFKLYSDLNLASAVTLTGNITGTYSTITFGTPVASCIYPKSTRTFVLDTNGNCWYINLFAGNLSLAANSLLYTGNLGHSSSSTNADFGVVAWMEYLFVIIGTSIDYISMNNLFGSGPPSASWTYAWKSDLTTTSYQHYALAATDNAIYICNGGTIASILQNSGTTFDPATASTYTYNTAALTLHSQDTSTYIAQLGTSLLIGGVLNYLYPWDRVSTSFNYPIILSENWTQRIVSTNSIAYVFCGNRGRIYQTNGANIQYYKKVPDYVTGAVAPYIFWGDAMYWRNEVYFTMTATTNAGTSITQVGGVWAIDTASDALRCINTLSFGSYGGTAAVLVGNQRTSPAGGGYFVGWTNNSTPGMDATSSTPYSNSEPYLDTDLVPVGTFFEKKTHSQIEWKTSAPLVAGESIKISYRSNLSDAFTEIKTWTSTGKIADSATANFLQVQWLQLRVNTSSTGSSPSYVRLKEIRIR